MELDDPTEKTGPTEGVPQPVPDAEGPLHYQNSRKHEEEPLEGPAGGGTIGRFHGVTEPNAESLHRSPRSKRRKRHAQPGWVIRRQQRANQTPSSLGRADFRGKEDDRGEEARSDDGSGESG
jgi:hypothetical protein